MNFVETKIKGAYIIEIERLRDERGFFARTWCQQELDELGLDTKLSQCSISFNPRRGTLRGMHVQLPPHAETKIVRCTRGAIFDVVIDLRPNSPSYMQCFGVKLTAENRKTHYVPKGCAHGFQTLVENCEVLYLISNPYSADYTRGVRWNDSQFNIKWPEDVNQVSKRDQNYADYNSVDFDPLRTLKV